MTINYNVTGQDRKNLVKKIEELSGEKAKYLGAPSMAYQIGAYHVSKTGELTWEDGTDAELLVESLLEAGFEAEASEEVDGLTITVPSGWMTGLNRQNLQNLIKSKSELIKKSLSLAELPEVIFNTDDTVSFPWFEATNTPEEIHAYSNLCLQMCKAAQEATRISPIEKIAENEKYAFRCFLLRLGFIGDEFKTDRKVLLRNFSGSSAFKGGHKKEYAPGLDPIPTPENTVKIDVAEAMRRLQDPQVQEEIRAIMNGEDGENE